MHLFSKKKNQLDLFTVHRWENVLPLKLHNNYDIKVNRNAFFVTPMECWTSLNSNVMIFIVSSKQKLNIKIQILARNPANFWFDLFRIRYFGKNFFSFKSYHHQKVKIPSADVHCLKVGHADPATTTELHFLIFTRLTLKLSL